MRIFLSNPPWMSKDRWGIRAGSRWPFTIPRKPGDLFPPYLPFPFYLAYTASLLKKHGFEVEILDAIALGWEKEKFFDFLKRHSFDIVLLETSTPSIFNDLEIAREIKTLYPKVKLVLVGPHAGFFQREILEENEFIDFVIKGEYEFAFLKLVEALSENKDFSTLSSLSYREKERVHVNEGFFIEGDLNKFPWPERESLPIFNYQDKFCDLPQPSLQILASRGCPYKCIFCLWPKLMYGGFPYRKRAPQDVLDEVEFCCQRWKFKSIYFDDDVFNLDRNQVVAISEEFIKRKIKIPWACMARADILDKELLGLMKASGLFAIKYGVESADREVLKASRKSLNLEKTVEVIQITRRLGIKVHLTFSLGLPLENKRSIEKTLSFAFRLRPDSLQFSLVTPFPGTDYFQILKEKGLLNTYDWSKFDGANTAVFSTEFLKKEELERALEKANRLWHNYYKKMAFLKRVKEKLRLEKRRLS